MLQRKKKKLKNVSGTQILEKKDVENTTSVNVKKCRLEDAFIVIYD